MYYFIINNKRLFTKPFDYTLWMVLNDGIRERRIEEMNGRMSHVVVLYLALHLHIILITQMQLSSRRKNAIVIKNAIFRANVRFLLDGSCNFRRIHVNHHLRLTPSYIPCFKN